MNNNNKIKKSANELASDSLAFAKFLHHEGLRPDLLLSVWPDGSIAANYIYQYFKNNNIIIEHYPIVTKGADCIPFKDINTFLVETNVSNLVVLIINITNISTQTLNVAEKLLFQKSMISHTVKVGCLYFNSNRDDKKWATPDFFLEKAEHDIEMPHELKGLSQEDVRKKLNNIWKPIK